MKNLFGHCIHRANVDWFEDDFFRLQIQEELHVVGNREQLSFPADIVVAEFDDVFDNTMGAGIGAVVVLMLGRVKRGK